MNSGDIAPRSSSDTNKSAQKAHSKSGECPVTGVVNRVKVPNENERMAVLGDPSIKTVMVSIESVRKLVTLHSETAKTYFRDDQTIITTTTTHDDNLKKLDWVEELDLVRRFGPDYHIPTEYSVYQTMSEAQQKQAIDDCMEGTEWFAKRLGNHAIEVLVQAKGWLQCHFERCQPTMERLGTDFVVFYATGYGSRVYELKEDLKTLISELKPSGILVIGKQSVRFLRKAPPEIVGAAGFRWQRKSGLVKDGHDPRKHEVWKKEVEEHLSCGQSIIDSFNPIKVKQHG